MNKIYSLLFCLLPLISCSQSKTAEDKTTITQVKPQDTYTTLQFEVEGKVCTAIIDKKYKSFAQKSEYPLSLFITVNMIDKDENGQATPAELEKFYAIQDVILSTLKLKTPFCHIGTTTMPGYHDIILYIPSGKEALAKEILDPLKSSNSRIGNYTFEQDPQWEAVSSFLEAVN